MRQVEQETKNIHYYSTVVLFYRIWGRDRTKYASVLLSPPQRQRGFRMERFRLKSNCRRKFTQQAVSIDLFVFAPAFTSRSGNPITPHRTSTEERRENLLPLTTRFDPLLLKEDQAKTKSRGIINLVVGALVETTHVHFTYCSPFSEKYYLTNKKSARIYEAYF